MGKANCVFAIGVSLLATLSVAGPANRKEIPVELRGGFLIVAKGSIGHLKDLSFVIDTGSHHTIVDEKIAHRAHLRKSGTVEQLAPSHTVQMQRVRVQDWSWAGKTLPALETLAFDLSPMSRWLGVQIDAILGLDVLCSSSFEVDYRYRRIYFGLLSTPENSVAFEHNLKALVVPSRVDGRPLHLLVDTGSDSLAIFADRLKELNVPGGNEKGRDLSGAVSFKTIHATQVQLGDRRLHDVQVFVTPAMPETQGYDGSLAPTAIGATRIYFDFERMRFGWDGP